MGLMIKPSSKEQLTRLCLGWTPTFLQRKKSMKRNRNLSRELQCQFSKLWEVELHQEVCQELHREVCLTLVGQLQVVLHQPTTLPQGQQLRKSIKHGHPNFPLI